MILTKRKDMRRVAIITGAARGLGRETALKFGGEGWAVTINYSGSPDDAASAVEEIGWRGGEAFVSRADVRDYPEVEAMVAETMARWGRVDVLVNNAGVTGGGLIATLKDRDWDDVVDTNLKGAFNAIKATHIIMTEQLSGHIINVSSIIGVRGKAGQAAYSSSKAGLIGLTKAAAVELAPYRVQVNAVLPGYMLTDMGLSAPDGAREGALNDNLLKAYSEPAEVAGFIYHLAGMKAVSGQLFNLDSRVI